MSQLLIEILYAAESMDKLAGDEAPMSPKVNNIPNQTPKEGTGVCQADTLS
jgi:hypothetical protein